MVILSDFAIYFHVNGSEKPDLLPICWLLCILWVKWMIFEPRLRFYLRNIRHWIHVNKHKHLQAFLITTWCWAWAIMVEIDEDLSYFVVADRHNPAQYERKWLMWETQRKYVTLVYLAHLFSIFIFLYARCLCVSSSSFRARFLIIKNSYYRLQNKYTSLSEPRHW